MTQRVNRRILLARHPVGAPTSGDFELVEGEIPRPGTNEVVSRTIYLSLDPYMRGRISASGSYAQAVRISEVMVGGAVSEVVASRAPEFAAGDIVFGYTGWQEYSVAGAKELRKVDGTLAPISTALSVLGMPGMAAYVGLVDIGQPKKRETVVVSAASGAVGSVVGQIARIKGCRVIGIAGSQAKCDYLIEELGFDAAVNHGEDGFSEALVKACPDGIDVYWENVGGHVLRAVLPLVNPYGRIPVCGQIAHYNDTEPSPGPDNLPTLMLLVLRRRLTVRGFIVFDFGDREQEFLDTVSPWVREGRIKYREDFADGLENAPRAFQKLFTGENFGKLIVRVGPEPAG